MAWSRAVELSVQRGNEVAVDMAGLSIAFRVVRSIDQGESYAEFTVHNAREETRTKLLIEGASLTFKAGYEDDVLGVIFIGSIQSSVSRLVGDTWVTQIRAVSQLTLWDNYVSHLSLSYAPGTALSQVIEDIAGGLGINLWGIENAAGLALPNGYAFVGAPFQAIQYVKQILNSNGLGLFWDNKELIIFEKYKDSQFTTVFLGYDSGLLSVNPVQEHTRPELDEAGEVIPQRAKIEFSALLNWRIRPNGVITIDTSVDVEGRRIEPSVYGSYVVESVEFSGDNYGGNFNVQGVASA